MTCCSFDASTKIHLYVHPSDLHLIRIARPVRAPLGLLRRLRTDRYRFCTRQMATGSNTIPGPLKTTSLMRPRVALIEESVILDLGVSAKTPLVGISVGFAHGTLRSLFHSLYHRRSR